MGNIQPVKFKNLGEFLDFLPKDELDIMECLRSIVFEVLPECREKLAYNVPFYYRSSRICFIWPSSVSWGGIDSGVAFGLSKGYLLTDEINYLDKMNRKEVRSKTFTSVSQIKPDLLKSYLFEALEVDEHWNKSS